MKPDSLKNVGTVGKLIKLRFFGFKNLQTLATKLGHSRNFLKTNAF